MEGDRKIIMEKLNESEKLDAIIDKFKKEKGTLISLLQDVSKEFGYLSEENLRYVSGKTDVPLSKLYSLVTFYNSFRLDPIGKHHICVCVGTACHVKGAVQIVETIERELQIKPGQRTEDNMFSLETVNCLGTCALGPLAVIDNEYHGNLDQKKITALVDKLKNEK